MVGTRIIKIADNIISPLGCGTVENYSLVSKGISGLASHADDLGAHEPFTGSIFNRDKMQSQLDSFLPSENQYTFFEKLCIYSAKAAIEESATDTRNDEVVFILSSTKGNVEVLANSETNETYFLSGSAQKIADFFENPNTPIVVSNACISGVCAQILATRLIRAGFYKTAVIIGCDVLSNFIISGFQSFKALSSTACKPYDEKRDGLNLGEAAATMILTSRQCEEMPCWEYVSGSIHNDASHISAPSRTAEGCKEVLSDLLTRVRREELAFVNGHGTATVYNDEMESIALSRVGLTEMPVNSLKGYYGHTLGAAGLLETIISMKSVENKMILGTKGYDSPGTSQKLNVSPDNQATEKNSFIKIISGFGGTNAGIVYRLIDKELDEQKINGSSPEINYDLIKSVRLTPEELSIDEEKLPNPGIDTLYIEIIKDYPKFYKMDSLSKLGLIASHILQSEEKQNGKKTAIILFNRSGSLCTDKNYQNTLNESTYFPSPSVFVYTLPNIVEGEICIRFGIQGETSFYILPGYNEKIMKSILESTMLDSDYDSVITGWIECDSDKNYLADLKLLKIWKN